MNRRRYFIMCLLILKLRQTLLHDVFVAKTPINRVCVSGGWRFCPVHNRSYETVPIIWISEPIEICEYFCTQTLVI